jgi:hypothetical protein
MATSKISMAVSCVPIKRRKVLTLFRRLTFIRQLLCVSKIFLIFFEPFLNLFKKVSMFCCGEKYAIRDCNF